MMSSFRCRAACRWTGGPGISWGRGLEAFGDVTMCVLLVTTTLARGMTGDCWVLSWHFYILKCFFIVTDRLFIARETVVIHDFTLLERK